MTTVTVSKAKLYASRIDLSAETRGELVLLLNQTLATAVDLQSQVKQAHWNVKGFNFLQLHQLFDEMSAELLEFIDLVAERITSLAGVAQGTARLAASESLVAEYPLNAVNGLEHLTALADRYGTFAAHVRNSIDQADGFGDASTADLYTEISRAMDKRLWFLEAHLH
ncbi:MAG: DNA starvation/stationary phase protection protein Dps [Cyanobacteria bacterium P01_F01_bin.42]